jgi:SAM-dependent methyltransferase
LSTNVAAVPLLWIIPLTLYLLTFVLAFSRTQWISHDLVARSLPFVLLVQVVLFPIELKRGEWLLFLLPLGCFFWTVLYCHGRLAQDRPHPQFLTEFYLWIAAGGVLGGLFNALIAPLIFDRLIEYPLAIVLACLLLPRSGRRLAASAQSSERVISRGRMVRRVGGVFEAHQDPKDPGGLRRLRPPYGTAPWITWGDVFFPTALGLFMLILGLAMPGTEGLWLKATVFLGLPAVICYAFIGRPLRFALGLGAVLLVGGFKHDAFHSQVVHQERSFFGVMAVIDRAVTTDPSTRFRYFVHGNTNHGQQSLDPGRHRQPLAYYFRPGPVGDIFDSLSRDRHEKRVAVLGLGAGALACYAEKGENWTFYEIDPAVVSIAQTYFTFLEDARERGVGVEVITGDARLSLARKADHSYDLIFADAFSSDAVPIHLLTREALELYLRKLADGGLLVFNVTNRYVDLEPVLGALAAHAGLVCLAREEVAVSKEEETSGKVSSHWVIMARQPSDLGTLTTNVNWRSIPPGPSEWTDDFSNLLGVMRW